MKRLEQIGAVSWMCLSVMVCILSYRMSLWSPSGPEGGFLPFCAGLMIGFSGLSLLIVERRRRDRISQPPPEGKAGQPAKNVWKRIGYIMVGFAAMAYFMPILGFITTAAIVLTFLFLLTQRQKWKRAVLVAIAFSVCFYFFFNLFDVRLPEGVFGF